MILSGAKFGVRMEGVTMTSEAHHEVSEVIDNPADFQAAMRRMIAWHVNGQWGDIDAHDVKVNEDAVKSGARILSEYTVAGVRLWVISDAAWTNDPSVREVTTILRPEDY